MVLVGLVYLELSPMTWEAPIDIFFYATSLSLNIEPWIS
jgi:hypothetical protein